MRTTPDAAQKAGPPPAPPKPAEKALPQGLPTGLSVAIGLAAMLIVLSATMLYGFFQAMQQAVIAKQEEQLLTLSKALATQLSATVEDCRADLETLTRLHEFEGGSARYFEQGDALPLRDTLRRYANEKRPKLAAVELWSETGERLYSTAPLEQYSLKGEFGAAAGTPAYTLLRTQKGFWLCVWVDAPGLRVGAMLDLQVLYDELFASVRVGSLGYAIIKDTTGTILMDQITDQIGIKSVEDRILRYPGIDLSGLESLIERQKNGRPGTLVYDSYWWNGSKPVPVKKMVGYAPVLLDGEFAMITSVVMDYEEVAGAVVSGVSRMVFAGLFLMLGLMLFLISIYELLKRQRAVASENVALRKINAALEELHRREEQIAHQQRLQMIGTFTGGIAHEFNNLLTPIMGYSGLLLETLPPDDPNREDIKEILEASQKARDITRQISVLSRKNASSAFRPIPIKVILGSALKMASAVAPAQVRMCVELDFSDSSVLGNETQIHQVALNLCTNAFHAIGEVAGTLTVQAKVLDVLLTPPELFLDRTTKSYLRVTFADSGCGIDPSYVDRIFDPFFTTKSIGEGTGLGLSIVQSILEEHHGAITVQSELGKGSVFTVWLPLLPAEEPAETRAVRPSVPPALSNRSILLVEDDIHVLRLLEKGLTLAGFAVTPFHSSMLAAEQLKNDLSYDVLITDYAMPQLLGSQLAREARAARPELRVLILTGLLKPEVLALKEEGIIDEYLVKPIVCDDVVRVLGSLAYVDERME